MKKTNWLLGMVLLPSLWSGFCFAQDRNTPVALYSYESKPANEEFVAFNPAKAPEQFAPLLKRGDRLAIIGDSITEQKMYSRFIENYLTACTPQLEITVRQLGWGGEKTDGFLRRMDRDCLTFHPTVATLCYGMNDSRYRPFDVTNGRWYRDHYTQIVKRLKEAGAKPIVGSPGCSGKIAAWIGGKAGSLQDHNLNLCALRDLALDVAKSEDVPFADIFWPMYQQQVLAPKKLNKSPEEFAVAGKDGIHPGWAGQVMMAYAFLNAMGLDGKIGEIQIDMENGKAIAQGLHEIKNVSGSEVTIVSHQFPYCSGGALDDDNSVRAGIALVPFQQKLNRFVLKVTGLPEAEQSKVTWGTETVMVLNKELAQGINLTEHFSVTPIDAAFAKVDAAVLAKQNYETEQIKRDFHSEAAKTDFAKVIEKTEAVRQPLADAVKQSVQPVEHKISIAPAK